MAASPPDDANDDGTTGHLAKHLPKFCDTGIEIVAPVGGAGAPAMFEKVDGVAARIVKCLRRGVPATTGLVRPWILRTAGASGSPQASAPVNSA